MNLATLAGAAALCLGAVGSLAANLPTEPTPAVESMPETYPESLVYVHDVNFEALIAGRVVLLDVAPSTRNYKGALDAAQFASFIESKRKNELYVAETFYARGTRGERTDVLTIYDKKHLKRIGEIALPGGKRGHFVSHRYTLQLVDNDRYLLLFNFTPAASVTMIDMDSRTILSETQIPGCGLVYPAGKRGFASLCSDGSMLTAQFDQKGTLIHQQSVASFFDVDDDPLFDKPVYIDKTAWFPSFKGDMQSIDLSGKTPVVQARWSLLNKEQKSEKWRPGGWQIATVNDRGFIYILMHKNGYNGSHKSGGSEVWVYDPVTQKRVNHFALKNWGVSIELTGGNKPFLVVTNGSMQLDVYDPQNGQWLKMIGDVGPSPFYIHAQR
jgi:methylamine dehydrogenase heavy chain